jgi:hypothetical protein
MLASLSLAMICRSRKYSWSPCANHAKGTLTTSIPNMICRRLNWRFPLRKRRADQAAATKKMTRAPIGNSKMYCIDPYDWSCRSALLEKTWSRIEARLIRFWQNGA